jgi:hypothetical protein
VVRGVRRWWSSPMLHRAVFEVLLLVAAWRLYRFGRYLVRDQRAEAFDNAAEVRWLQEAVGLDVERGVQQAVLVRDGVIELINGYYVYAHFPLTIGCLAWLVARDLERYVVVRRALMGAMAVGLAIHALYPLAPPRMMRGMGMVDTLAVHGPRIYSRDHFSSITNQFAAMPSFHVGWSVLFAWVIITTARTRWRWLAVAHPAMMTLAVTATANHFVLDAVAGAVVIGVGLEVARRVPAPAPAPVPMRRVVLGGLLERAVGAVREAGQEVDDPSSGGPVRGDVHDDGPAGPVVVGGSDDVGEVLDGVARRLAEAHGPRR